jgi:hypothetical protein
MIIVHSSIFFILAYCKIWKSEQLLYWHTVKYGRVNNYYTGILKNMEE